MLLHSQHRTSRAMVYVLLLLAGVASYTDLNVTFYISVALRVLGAFLIIGSAISLAGHVKKDNRLEILGFPLLVNAMGALSLSAFIAHGEADPTRYLTGLLLIAFTLSLHSRYRDLQALIALGDDIRGRE